jgi:hypothetical protein
MAAHGTVASWLLLNSVFFARCLLLHSFSRLVDCCAQLQFVGYPSCLWNCGTFVIFKWCLLCTLTLTLLYPGLVDCWIQLTLWVIKAAHGTMASLLVTFDSLTFNFTLFWFDRLAMVWLFELYWHRLDVIWILGTWTLTTSCILANGQWTTCWLTLRYHMLFNKVSFTRYDLLLTIALTQTFPLYLLK